MVEKRLLIGESRFPNLRYRLRTGWGGGGGGRIALTVDRQILSIWTVDG